MSNLKIECRNCNQEIVHHCHNDLAKALGRLENMKIEWVNRDFIPEEARKYPFFSEAFLYEVFGKNDARSILAVVRNIIRAIGVEPSI